MKKKIVSILLLFIMLLLACTNVLAATKKVESSKTTLELVEKPICEINFGGTGHFTKELTSFDAKKKELTITLTVKNTAEKVELTKPVEIFFVLDNSNSMTKTYQGKTKKDYVIETANHFTDTLLESFSNAKIGIVSFSSTKEFVQGTTGSLADATLLLPLSSEKETIKNTVSSYLTEAGPYTNIEAGLSIAQSNFTDSKDSQKFIILVSDGVPNLCLDTQTTLAYSGVIAEKTKARLQAIETSGIHTFSVLLGLNQSHIENENAPLVEGTDKHMTYRQLAEEIFGTVTNPTAGDFYFIDYATLDTTVNDDIFKDITYVEEHSLKNIIIKDYIPQEIMDNFDFAHVTPPTIGTVTNKVDTTDNNSITWTIPELKEGQTATLSYKLKQKTSVDESVINKILPTNTKVDINFETPDGEKETVSSDTSPKVKILYDKTIAKDPLPQAGNYIGFFLAIVSISVTIYAISRIIRFNKLS